MIFISVCVCVVNEFPTLNTDNNLSKFNKKDGKKDSKYNNSMALSMRKKINKIEDIKYKIQKYQI